MRKMIRIAAFMAAAMLAISCGGNKKTAPAAETPIGQAEAEADSTLYGVCGDGTSMNSLELITDKGVKMTILLADADTCANVQGGLFTGDRLAVVAYKGADGEITARTVINLTTLLGKWSDINRTFEIQEGGTVECSNQEPKPYVDWKILNGKLVLTADTFSIYALGPDSLLLENANGIYAYKRVVK